MPKDPKAPKDPNAPIPKKRLLSRIKKNRRPPKPKKEKPLNPNTIITKSELHQMQSLPLEAKILKTRQRIIEWYERFNGDVYISFSGGKDSTVLLDIARSIYPDIPVVFCDTGLEYPEVRDFVKTFDNITWIKPKMNFIEVIGRYGYPFPSKEQAQYIKEYRNTNSKKLRKIRWKGNKSGRGKISEKWKYLVDSEFKISDSCCNVMKKNPFKKYEKDSGFKCILGTMAVESSIRLQSYLKSGCNTFETSRPLSKPLSFWVEQDILEYLYKNELEYAKCYGDLTYDDESKEYKLSGLERTGCMFCLFGINIEQVKTGTNRIELMKGTHPKLYNYCINNLGIGKFLDFIDIPY